MLVARKIVFFNTQGNCYFCTGTKLSLEGGVRLRVLRDRAATYYDATIYHIHLITPTYNHTYILLQRQFITTTFNHKDRLS